MSFLEPNDFSKIDGTHIKNLKKGKFDYQDSIDLHGLRLHEAELEFYDFLDSSVEQGYRKLLVVTGKGLGSPEGNQTIKQSLTNWVNKTPHQNICSKHTIFKARD